jgi:predicted flavoprotein YhiN
MRRSSKDVVAMLTPERAEQLANCLLLDESLHAKLTELSAEEAVLLINKNGHDFTVEELEEFAEGIVAIDQQKKGELSTDQLESVAGGVMMPTWPFLPTIKPTQILIKWFRKLLGW